MPGHSSLTLVLGVAAVVVCCVRGLVTSSAGAPAPAAAEVWTPLPEGAPAPAVVAEWTPPLVSKCDCSSFGSSPTSDGRTSDVIAESKEVARLSDEIEQAQVVLDGYRLKLRRTKEYYQEREANLKTQLDIRLRAANSTGSFVRDEAYYANKMCSLAADALFGGSAMHELIEICLGRDLSALSVAASAPCACERNVRLSLAAAKVRASSPIAALRSELKALQAAIAKAKEEYRSQEWAQTTSELNAREAALGSAAVEVFASREKSEQEAFSLVKKRFCKKVNRGVAPEEMLKSCSRGDAEDKRGRIMEKL